MVTAYLCVTEMGLPQNKVVVSVYTWEVWTDIYIRKKILKVTPPKDTPKYLGAPRMQRMSMPVEKSLDGYPG